MLAIVPRYRVTFDPADPDFGPTVTHYDQGPIDYGVTFAPESVDLLGAPEYRSGAVADMARHAGDAMTDTAYDALIHLAAGFAYSERMTLEDALATDLIARRWYAECGSAWHARIAFEHDLDRD